MGGMTADGSAKIRRPKLRLSARTGRLQSDISICVHNCVHSRGSTTMASGSLPEEISRRRTFAIISHPHDSVRDKQ